MRYADELLELTDVAHVSDAHGLLGEGLPYGTGELDLDPVVRRLGERVPYIVAEINEPDPAYSDAMKAGYREIERALAAPADPPRRRRSRLPVDAFDWQAVVGRRDPVPSVLELEERFGGRRVLITGGGGWIGGRLATLLLGFRPERVTLLDSHEASLTADRRGRSALQLRGHRARARRHPRRRPARRGRGPRPARRDLPPRRLQARRLGRDPPRGVRRHQPAGLLERAPRRGGVRRRDRGRGLDRQGGARRVVLRAHEALHGAADRARRRRVRRAARQRAGQRRQRVRAVPAPGARRHPAHGHRHRDDALLDHGGARRARARPRRAAGRGGRGAGDARTTRPSSRSASWRSASGARRAPASRPTSSCWASAPGRR